MNGIWEGTDGAEALAQNQLTRHELLIVCPGSDLTAPWPPFCSSGMADLDPNTIAPGTINTNNNPVLGPEGAPHFVMSGETTDGAHSYGFEFVLFTNNLTTPAVAAAGDFDVTIWVLIANTQDPYGSFLGNVPVWGSFALQSGVALQQHYHSFDVNATCVRFQFGNLSADPAHNNTAIAIAFAPI